MKVYVVTKWAIRPCGEDTSVIGVQVFSTREKAEQSLIDFANKEVTFDPDERNSIEFADDMSSVRIESGYEDYLADIQEKEVL